MTAILPGSGGDGVGGELGPQCGIEQLRMGVEGTLGMDWVGLEYDGSNTYRKRLKLVCTRCQVESYAPWPETMAAMQIVLDQHMRAHGICLAKKESMPT